MDIYNQKWTALQSGIFSLLCIKAGEKFSQRDIAKLLKVSPTAIAKSIKALKDSNLIRLEKTKTINFVSFNRDERKAVELKRTENLKNIYLSGLSGFLEQQLPGGTIMLFGSYSRGEDTISSDIDIAVVGRKDKALGIQNYERTLNRKINVNFYKSWQEIHTNLKNNILGGMLLHGAVEL